jgi:glycosyltransferase involved in cell wall biosynthesis
MRAPGTTRIGLEAAALAERLRNPEIAFAHTFRRPPYGGANQFLLALRGELRRRGLRVGANVVTRATRACLLNSFAFDDERLRRTLRPGCRVVHRVDGPVSLYRGFDDGADDRIVRLNDELADATVFQSRYSLAAHEELGIRLRNPIVISNAVDPRIFHPAAERSPLFGRRIRLIATSWSPNPNKGAATYRLLDRALDPSRYELTFVGQIAEPLERARVVPPVGSEALAALLREHDVYVAASLNDPCSNALLEGLACGLPAVYARSGGHPELVGEGGLGFSDPDELPSLLDRLVDEYEERRSEIRVPALAEVADRYLDVLGLGGE